jgi:hypothetical protein
MIHVGGVADIDDFRDLSEVHIVVALDEHDALGAVGIDGSQPPADRLGTSSWLIL